ncbi:2-succinyl-5-enolpyruvyl-6-hydroxy-3-cyclohexene-1-carboxylate synthase [Lentiprolixibacter aurantiacus]|uniref:2-succinyl-5-enolpyruvyl-6-hydroxy-3-cyclohexene-1-carboxylate synthase n=1 Tax=Lentiprolixibacter aurantiacus TaxID=2993939 RepID=A0AAE3MM79_9FLAO|nr:2-succinyl-5-enolpyruvyl-6-hydroxy-3-cyclohexene-1-carboxylate synthase [Lentiprolixibacter aurantiacus]MCX2719437.1 thiamine pyrophosphate-binding protein [Lentiprolixibacter aurantiacus]
MKYSSIPAAQAVVMHCKHSGIRHIVISPGSRNAPLVLGFTNDPFFECYSVVDERSAAFFALGMAQQLKEPVAAICTSGSALLNYYPAVAEAFYSDIPLVLISADRPSYKIDRGDGQTIRQDRVFDRHIAYSAHLRQDVTHATSTIATLAPQMLEQDKDLESIQEVVGQYNYAELQRALQTALQQSSPVHINVPFEEPLYGLSADISVENPVYPTEAPSQRAIGIEKFSRVWRESGRKMILVGVNPPGQIEQELLDRLAEDSTVLIFTETTSNLHHTNSFPSIDSIIAPIEKSADPNQDFEALKPEILLTFGGLIVSKKIKAFLREFKPQFHWHVHPIKAYDTFFSLTHHVKSDPNTFLEQLLQDYDDVPGSYRDSWLPRKSYVRRMRSRYLKQIPFSDFKAFSHLMNSIPAGYMVQLANSSTVRYAQLFDMSPANPVFCNRGTSGIDGSTSTAVGAALHYDNPTLLISGDLSFLYDINGLWNNYLRPDLRIVVVNNGGGGIFRILPGKEESPEFEQYFETPQKQSLGSICATYGLEYCEAIDEESLVRELSDFYNPSRTPKLLDIRTPRTLNDKILLGYFEFLSSNKS